MPTSNSKAAALLAELDAEFGKAARKKEKRALTDSDIRKALNRDFHQRIDGSASLIALQAYANSKARSWLEVPGFRAVARITNIQHEHCRCCSGTVSFIGNQFTEFENQRMRAKVQSPELVLHDELGFELEHRIDEWHHDVDFCVSCLRLSHNVSDLVAIAFINGQPAQALLALEVRKHKETKNESPATN